MQRAKLGVIIGLTLVASSVFAALDTNLTAYTAGASRAAFVALEEQARDATKVKDVEETMVAVLSDKASTPDAMEYACRILRVVGSEACVKTVAPLLTDPKLSHYARFALQGNASPAVDAALEGALKNTSGALKVGIINSLGARRDANAVPALGALTADADKDIAIAAMAALGHIATVDAASALQASGAGPALLTNKQNSLIECADRLEGRDGRKLATAIFSDLAGNGANALIKLAGVRGLLKTSPKEGTKCVMDLFASTDADLFLGAAQLVGELPKASDAEAVAKNLPAYRTASQAAIIAGLCRRSDKAGSREIAKLLSSERVVTQIAAIEAIGIVGTVDDVPVLLNLADGSTNATAKAARAALEILPGVKASKAIASAAKATGDRRVQAVEILGARLAQSEVPTLVALLDDSDAQVRGAATKALRSVAGPSAVAPLIAHLKAATLEADATRLVQVLLAAADRSADKEGIVKDLVPMIEGTNPLKKVVFPVLGKLGGATALAAVRAEVAKEGAWHRDAVRALADWSDDDALEPLLGVAKEDKDDVVRVLALRGYIRIVADKKNRPVASATELIGKALNAASRDEEKTQALAGLGAVKGPEAVKIAATYLDKPALAPAATTAISQSAKDLNAKEGKSVLALLKKARAAATDAATQKELDALVAKFSK